MSKTETRRKAKETRARFEAVQKALGALTFSEMQTFAWQLRNWAMELDFSSGTEAHKDNDFDKCSADHFAALMDNATRWELPA